MHDAIDVARTPQLLQRSFVYPTLLVDAVARSELRKPGVGYRGIDHHDPAHVPPCREIAGHHVAAATVKRGVVLLPEQDDVNSALVLHEGPGCTPGGAPSRLADLGFHLPASLDHAQPRRRPGRGHGEGARSNPFAEWRKDRLEVSRGRCAVISTRKPRQWRPIQWNSGCPKTAGLAI